MKVGILDLGTNTFNILIVNIEKGKPIKHLLNAKSAVMLASGGIEKGYIAEEIFNRAFQVLTNFREMLNAYSCEHVIAFGTSAIRSAKNSSEFIGKVSRELQINIEAISGDQEAEYIYYGVKEAVEFTNENYLILDIGGGSNEFIIANKNELLWKHSFPLGGARLIEKFKPNNPITSEEIDKINSYLNDELELLKQTLVKFPCTKLVGASGAFDTFAEMLYFEKNGNKPSIELNAFSISINDFNNLHRIITQSTREERLLMPALDSVRVDTVVVATIFTALALKLCGANEIIQSGYSLKEGVAASYF